MTLRSFASWFLFLCVPFYVITAYHPELGNWWVMGSLIASFWGGVLAVSPTVKEKVRTVTRTVIYLIGVDATR